MRSIKLVVATLAVASFAFTSACKKDEEAKTDDTATTDDTAAKTTDTPTPDTDTPTDEPSAGAAMSKEEMGEKGVAMMEAMANAIDENKEDCAAMATAIQKVADENRDFMAEAKKQEESNPEYKKWFDEQYGEKTKELTEKMGPGMQACGADPAVQAAMKSLAGDE
jgi:hypothetical protein